MGVRPSGYGIATTQQTLFTALAHYSTAPQEDLLELLRRDILNIALGNSDNHPRNQSVLKRPDGSVRLSPLYDFAPMILDPQGIPRICRWGVLEPNAREVDWTGVGRFLQTLGVDVAACAALFDDLAARLRQLPEAMVAAGCGADLAERLRRPQQSLREGLLRGAEAVG